MTAPVLDIRNVTKTYPSGNRGKGTSFYALKDVSLTIGDTGRIIAIAGESGSGKTTLANVILGFVTPDSGHVRLDGQPIDWRDKRALFEYRRQVQVVFQDPFATFNPFYRVRHVFDLSIRSFLKFPSRAAAREAIEHSLSLVGLRGDDVLDKYPHQLSGGQRQRVMFARAHMLRPRVIVADEPVSMVDASLRRSILDVMLRLRDEGISFVYITHDLGTVHQVADELLVLYRGRLVERGPAAPVIDDPHHPYLKMLVESVPPIGRDETWCTAELPDPGTLLPPASGCVFRSLCPRRMAACDSIEPALVRVADHGDAGPHSAACLLYQQPA